PDLGVTRDFVVVIGQVQFELFPTMIQHEASQLGRIDDVGERLRVGVEVRIDVDDDQLRIVLTRQFQSVLDRPLAASLLLNYDEKSLSVSHAAPVSVSYAPEADGRVEPNFGKVVLIYP
ncbi:MAG: hypothetical protein MJA32_07810, partial [Proteobacteria bacterium]|nr:hypothetical protein [Pseudomonadota bacterium]